MKRRPEDFVRLGFVAGLIPDGASEDPWRIRTYGNTLYANDVKPFIKWLEKAKAWIDAGS